MRSQTSSAEVFLDTLVKLGIRHVFANAGTDFAPVIEAMVKARDAGRPLPDFHTIPHENLAVSMAHGYFLACGEPAAAMVHVTVGTANALCAVMNASRDQVPLLLFAGRTPSTETGHAGSRNANIHWGQDSFDQGGMVREYVKWDYELRAGQPVDVVVRRALDIAMSEPRGPVYLTLPRELLGDAANPGSGEPRPRAPGAIPAVPDAAAIARAAEWIRSARFPLIITATSGRRPENVQLLSDLAQRFGIAVSYPGEPGARDVNIPSTHPMYLGRYPRDELGRADVIVVLDSEVPWWPAVASPHPDARLIHIAPDPFYSRYPHRGFAMDLAISGMSTAALRMLGDALAATAAQDAAVVEARKAEIAGIAAQRAEQRRRIMAAAADQRPIQPAWVAACVNAAKSRDAIIVNELGVPMDLLDLQLPRSYISTSPAAGLGFGLGGALGAKLGAPDRQVILIVGDGSLMFGNPVAALHVARADGLPTLTIVMNNGRWHAVHRSTLGMYPAGSAAAVETMPLVELGPPPDYAAVCRACGGYGETVTEPADLPAALQRALAAVDRGQAALLDVIVAAAGH
jgi:acetolactate synthase-1/2/3 large subunit